MAGEHRHTIHGRHHHFGWDNSFPPVMRVAPGATLDFECVDAGGGQVSKGTKPADLTNLDFGRVNPVTGPIYVEGAKPGDVLKVTFESFTPSGFGWTANIPGFGLLADQFPDPALKLWSYDATGGKPAMFSPTAKVPLKPFCGTVGVALAESGLHSVVPPRRVGGNLDIRDLAAGSVLYLPVEVEGALFSIGDGHAVQGDGEVCGTAIETPLNVVLTLDVDKKLKLRTPCFTTPGPVSGHFDKKGYEVATGIGPDLMEAARGAVSQMIDILGAHHSLSAIDAYMLSSVCADLRISEIVDQPNWVVSFYFPRVVFE
jgi:acetamidase/formamidase